MTISRTQAILLGVVALILLVVGGVIGSRCSGPGPGPQPDIVTGIDAGPGERLIDERLDGAIQAGRVRIEQIEEKFVDDLAAFDARQREEYEQLRDGDLEAAARMLSEWNRSRRDAGQ